MGVPVLSAMFLKFICGLISLTIELFIYCYGFNHIETAVRQSNFFLPTMMMFIILISLILCCPQKSVLNFGVYSSNWTEMDLTFKKTMLLTMKMNSSHKRAMKVSPNSAVGLEMFARVGVTVYNNIKMILFK